jgi:hypothetical protein
MLGNGRVFDEYPSDSGKYEIEENNMKKLKSKFVATVATMVLALTSIHAAEPRSVSGIYPSLAMFNKEGECGTGAVVPWAGRLWVITYAPHMP